MCRLWPAQPLEERKSLKLVSPCRAGPFPSKNVPDNGRLTKGQERSGSNPGVSCASSGTSRTQRLSNVQEDIRRLRRTVFSGHPGVNRASTRISRKRLDNVQEGIRALGRCAPSSRNKHAVIFFVQKKNTDQNLNVHVCKQNGSVKPIKRDRLRNRRFRSTNKSVTRSSDHVGSVNAAPLGP